GEGVPLPGFPPGPRLRQPARRGRRAGRAPPGYFPHLGEGQGHSVDPLGRRAERERLHPGGEGGRGALAPSAPRARVATTVASSLISTGLATCIWNPARSARRRSSLRANAVSAAAGTRPPRSDGSARTR